jgi:hypothetical protein
MPSTTSNLTIIHGEKILLDFCAVNLCGGGVAGAAGFGAAGGGM